MQLAVPARPEVPLVVKPKHDQNGQVKGYELSRPARIGVQLEFSNYLDGGPWEQTRMHLASSLGEQNLQFVILESTVLVEAVNAGAVDMAITDAGSFIRFEMTNQLIGLSSLWPVFTADPSYAQGMAAIGELLTAAKLRGLPGLWHGHILRERFGNCRHAGLFRVEDGLNRRQLEKYLQTAAARCAGPDADRGEALSRQILACYDRLCAAHVPKK